MAIVTGSSFGCGITTTNPTRRSSFETKRREDNVILKERGGVRKSAVRWLLAGHMPERKHMLNPNDHEAFVAVQRFCHRMLQLNARRNARRLPARGLRKFERQ